MANDRIILGELTLPGMNFYNATTGEVMFSGSGIIDLNSPFTFKTVKERTPMQKMGIDKLTFNNPATIIHHIDGKKTVVKTTDNDSFDPIYGFLLAYFQKTSGMTKTQANKFLDEVNELAVKQELVKGKKKGKVKVIPPIINLEFKVGDKIRYTNENSSFFNETGIIRFDDGEKSLRYAVEWDDENVGGHDCSSKSFKGFNHSHGLWVDGCDLKLI